MHSPTLQDASSEIKCSDAGRLFLDDYGKVYCAVLYAYVEKRQKIGRMITADYNVIASVIRAYQNLVLTDSSLPEISFDASTLAEKNAQVRLIQSVAAVGKWDAGDVGDILRELYALRSDNDAFANQIISPRTAKHNARYIAPTDAEKQAQDESVLAMVKKYGTTLAILAALIGLGYVGTNVYRSYALIRASKSPKSSPMS